MSSASDEFPVDALHGAHPYLKKPHDLSRAKVPGFQPHRVDRFGALIGANQSMQSVYELIGRVAPTNAGVLIWGETGTGKELVAQTIHALSRRSGQAFLALNCGAMSAALIESELFGHERGSFTGADRLHKGYFERADQGTLFLDEICEMPGDLQVRLLRALETSAVTRVGGTESLKFDVRIIAATNRPPEQAVAAGRLRQDLLYRLNVFLIELPPLRERGRDVLLLAEEFLSDLNLAEGTDKRFTAASTERLLRHTWPGNVRELRNVIHRAFILAGEDVGVDCVAPSLDRDGDRGSFATGESRALSLVIRTGTSLAEAERRLILAALEYFGGDKQKAALALEISVKTIYNRLREYRADSGSLRTGESFQKVAPLRPRRGTSPGASGGRPNP
jgi:two-component system, NtrC family, response regulator AtoC